MKKVMVIGAIDSGKTSLLMAMNGETGIASKTQTLIYNSLTIDTPGEYIENPRMYKALLSTSQEAGCILFTQDSTVDQSIFPPGFACAFNCSSIGVITKIDHENANLEKARDYLQNLTLRGPIFEVSALTGEGIEKVKDFLKFNL